ncbi:hypothetical protein D3C80_1462180 [compost metagenome]
MQAIFYIPVPEIRTQPGVCPGMEYRVSIVSMVLSQFLRQCSGAVSYHRFPDTAQGNVFNKNMCPFGNDGLYALRILCSSQQGYTATIAMTE